MKIKREMELDANVELIGITLLSAEEAQQVSEKTLQVLEWWWLRAAGAYNPYCSIVDDDGKIYLNGAWIDNDTGGVRPALIFKSDELKPKDKFTFKDKEFIVITENLALSTEIIGYGRFDLYTNDYEKSEIKQRLERWYWNDSDWNRC